jgi:cyclase
MLKTRIIPVLLWNNNSLIKGKNFNSWRRVSSLIPSVKIYNSRDVDELIFLDISATNNNRIPDEYLIKQLASECSVPLTVGGGITELYQVEHLLASGADTISSNPSAFYKENLVSKIAKKFGSQCVVVSIDVRKIENKYFCYSNSGNKRQSIEPVQWARNLQDMGCGEILLTSIDKEGEMKGYDLDISNQISNAINIPVIACGGAGNYDHMFDVISMTKVSAVAASSIFHFTELTPTGAKEHLMKKGINVRK